MTSAHRPLRWLPAWRAIGIAYIGVIIAMSLLPPPELPLDPGPYDKVWHAIGYALAAIWTVWVVAPGRALYVRLAALIALGVALEAMQQASGWRTGDPLDALANTVGVLIGGGVAWTPVGRALEWVDRRLPVRRAGH